MFKNMQTQINTKEKGNRKKYEAPVVVKLAIDTEFTYFSTSVDPTPPNPGGNSLGFNPLKFFK
jgi:hypothetical protein